MHKIINKIFALSVLTAAAVLTPQHSLAQTYWDDLTANQNPFGQAAGLKPRPANSTEPAKPAFNPQYKSTLGHQYGFSPVFRNWMLRNDVETMELPAVPTLREDTITNVAGCVFDTHEAILSNLTVDSDNFVDYLSSPLGTFMIAALFTSPATAAAYDSLYAYAGSRVDLMQSRCNAAQSATDGAAQARWQALQECVFINATVPAGTVGDQEDYARAYKFCLLSSEYDDVAGETSAQDLLTSQANVLGSSKWSGTLFNVLEESSLCYTHTGDGSLTAAATASDGNACALMTFLPNFRWCTGSASDRKVCQEDVDVKRVAPPVISSRQIYDMAFAFSEPYIQYGLEFARRLVKQPGIGTKGALAISHLSEFSERQPGQQDATYSTVLGATIMSNSLISEASDYMGCSPNFARMRLDGYLVSEGSLPISQTGVYTAAGNYSVDYGIIDSDDMADYYHLNMFLDGGPGVTAADIQAGLTVVKDEFWNYEGGAFAGPLTVEFAGPPADNVLLTGFGNAAIHNPFMAVKLILQTLSCTMLYEQRLSLADFVQLNASKEHAQPLLYAVRSRWAYLTADKVLRFLKYKLRLAEIGYAYNNAVDANGGPDHVTKTLDILVDMVDSDIRSLERSQEGKEGFGTMMARFIEQTKGK